VPLVKVALASPPLVVNFLAVPRAKLDSILVEDLAIIYMQYDKFEDKLK